MNNKIDFAFLDSGTGGIPYMISLHEKMPEAKCVYLGDTLHFPYGEKTPEEVTKCASETISQIIRTWNPKVIVVACNTISVTALEDLRKLFPEISIIGTVPAIKLAAKITKNKRIGLLATNATVRHPYCQKLIEDFASDCFVAKRGDPDLVNFIEKRYFESSEEERLEAVKPAADFFKSQGCDTVILGCTHFTHIFDEMKKACGDEIQVVDSRDGVANQAVRKWREKQDSSYEVRSKKYDLETARPASQNHKICGNLCESADKIQNLTFFVTKADEKEEEEYKTLCKNMKIPYGGIL